jgi:uncharacterized membrane protein
MITRRWSRWLVAILFIAAGVNHFRSFAFYCDIVPPMFPSPGGLVIVSGIFEIVGGAALLIEPLRRLAGWGLIALLIAVFPANIYMAVSEHFADSGLPRWALWARLPVQGILIAWVWYVALARKRNETCARAI